jgi:hypothetical protein
MIPREEVQEILNNLGKYLVTESRKNLTRKGKKFSNTLYDSLDYETKANENSIEFEFSMEDYGKFIDKGVRGAGGVRKTTSRFNNSNNKGKLWKIKAKGSQYKFGKSGGIKASHFKTWAGAKGLSPYAVAKAVYHQGIETTNFISRPFELAWERLPEEIVEAYALDIEIFIDFVLNKR